MNDLGFSKDLYLKMLERIEMIEGFSDRPDNTSLCCHPDSASISVLVYTPDNQHLVRQWLRDNLGRWEDRVSYVSKTGSNTYQVCWAGVSTDWVSITLFANDETIKPFVGEHCAFVPDESAQHSARLVCQVN